VPGLVDVVPSPPGQAESTPRTGFDLNWTSTTIPSADCRPDLYPRAHRVIETHLDLGARLRRAAARDLVFPAKRDGAEQPGSAGLESATRMPPECDPAIHRQHAMSSSSSCADSSPALSRSSRIWISVVGSVASALAVVRQPGESRALILAVSLMHGLPFYHPLRAGGRKMWRFFDRRGPWAPRLPQYQSR
jgi:hypothetical protein